jgi:Chitobiase/beta-hexosaminidase C-terminal domain
LHRFTGPPDGAIPQAGLILDAAGNLYGTTYQGGTGGCFIAAGYGPEYLGCGTLFKLDPNGNETVLFSFSGAAGLDWGPQTSLTLDAAGNLFGTTSQGGAGCGGLGCGGLFQFSAGIVPPQVNAPIFLPPGGAYTSIQFATISDSTVGSTIYYTIDGSAPTTSSTKYVGAITVNTSNSINAIAAAAGFSNSSIATAAFTISTPDFMLSPAFTNLTVQPGGQGADMITIAPQNGAFANPVKLSCSVIGPQPLPTCALSPASVTPGTASPTSILTITAPLASARFLLPSDPHLTGSLCAMWLSLVVLGLALFAGPKKESRRYGWRYCFLALALMQVACGSGSSGVQNSLQSYTVTVTGASTTIQHSTQVTVTVP